MSSAPKKPYARNPHGRGKPPTVTLAQMQPVPSDNLADLPVLLLCPFCEKRPDGPIDATRVLGVWRIVHRDCLSLPPLSIERPSKSAVIAAWNRRAPPDLIVATVAMITDNKRGQE